MFYFKISIEQKKSRYIYIRDIEKDISVRDNYSVV